MGHVNSSCKSKRLLGIEPYFISQLWYVKNTPLSRKVDHLHDFLKIVPDPGVQYSLSRIAGYLEMRLKPIMLIMSI